VRPSAIIVAVQTWQADPSVETLTCGYDSRHQPLYAVEVGDRVMLFCPDCGYEQAEIPEEVLRRAGLTHG
jgi:Zn ribbon nucleic-acid-binding protein